MYSVINLDKTDGPQYESTTNLDQTQHTNTYTSLMGVQAEETDVNTYDVILDPKDGKQIDPRKDEQEYHPYLKIVGEEKTVYANIGPDNEVRETNFGESTTVADYEELS